MKLFRKLCCLLLCFCILTLSIANTCLFSIADSNTNITFEESLKQFPQDYRVELNKLHSLYPNWVFTADTVSESFNTLVYKESVGYSKKQININIAKTSRLSMNENSYDWDSGKYFVDSSGFACASREVIAYYMDPRNFLNENDIFMFLKHDGNSDERFSNTTQNTFYYLNFNVLNSGEFWHQESADVCRAYAEGQSFKEENPYTADKTGTLIFRIPVFSDLPIGKSSLPPNSDKANNYYFKNIEVSGLTPKFDMYNYNYDLQISGDTHIKVTLPSGASLTGKTVYNVTSESAEIILTVTAETGYSTEYYINVNSNTNAKITISDKEENPNPVMRGDVNEDGEISILDLAGVKMHLIGMTTLTGRAFEAADVSGDGRISVTDLADIKMHLLGIKNLSEY